MMNVKENITQINRTIEQLKQRIEILEAEKTKKHVGLDMNPSALWTPKHIAKYTGFSYGYVTQYLLKTEDFPPSINRITHTTRQRKLYKAGEIIAYFNKR